MAPLITTRFGLTPREERRFNRLRDKPEMDGWCWCWTGCTDKKGYGRFWFRGRCVWAHRLIYELAYGAPPDGWHVHHSCHTRGCVNSDHLEATEPTENGTEGVDYRERCRHRRRNATYEELMAGSTAVEREPVYASTGDDVAPF